MQITWGWLSSSLTFWLDFDQPTMGAGRELPLPARPREMASTNQRPPTSRLQFWFPAYSFPLSFLFWSQCTVSFYLCWNTCPGGGAEKREKGAGLATEDLVERMTEGVCLNKAISFLHELPKCLFQLGARCVHLACLQACEICVFVAPLQTVYLAYEAAF